MEGGAEMEAEAGAHQSGRGEHLWTKPGSRGEAGGAAGLTHPFFCLQHTDGQSWE